jgi:uncharacterized protein (DUF983 family)
MPRPMNPEKKKAIDGGLKFYRGPACRHGHDGERYVKTNACRQCVAEQGKTRPDRQPKRGRPVAAADEFEQLK